MRIKDVKHKIICCVKVARSYYLALEKNTKDIEETAN